MTYLYRILTGFDFLISIDSQTTSFDALVLIFLGVNIFLLKLYFIKKETVTKKTCGCEVPCYYSKYSAEVSYSYFPDPGTAAAFIRNGYYGDHQYQR